MKAEILNTICQIENEIYTNEIINNIVNDGIRKFDPLSSEGICLFEIPQWVSNKLKQCKQDSYKWFLPVVKDIADRIGEDFQELFDGTEENYRDCHFAIYYK